jgi:hypothetical protein
VKFTNTQVTFIIAVTQCSMARHSSDVTIGRNFRNRCVIIIRDVIIKVYASTKYNLVFYSAYKDFRSSWCTAIRKTVTFLTNNTNYLLKSNMLS